MAYLRCLACSYAGALLLMIAAHAQPADETQPAPAAPTSPDVQQSMCMLIESAANANALPVEFFARVIWQESRFSPDAVGPVTRNGKRALGIASSCQARPPSAICLIRSIPSKPCRNQPNS
jgi:hypothetical protein